MAVLTKAAFLSKYLTIFADNVVRAISEQDLRDFREDIADSFLPIADSFVETVSVDVSSAELLALNATPKVLIPAPGAGKYIQVLYGYIFLDFGGTAYSNTTTEIEYATGRDIVGTITGFLNVGVDTIYNITATTGGPYAFSEVENSEVRYRATSADPTTGNGTIKINLVYRTVTI